MLRSSARSLIYNAAPRTSLALHVPLRRVPAFQAVATLRSFNGSSVALQSSTSTSPAAGPSSADAASSASNNGGSGSSGGRTAGLFFFSGLVALTFGLGTWQSIRYFWKKDVIEQRTAALSKEPIDISAVSLADMPPSTREQLQLVKLKGTIDWKRAVKVSPRPPPKGLPDNFIPAAGNNGALVIVPLRRADGTEVLLFRGWYPLDALPYSATSAPREEEIEVFGALKAAEEPGSWATPHRPEKGEFAWLDLQSIASHVGLNNSIKSSTEASTPAPVVCVEAVEPLPPRPNIFPLTRLKQSLSETFVMPFTHLTYACTWYTLSALGVLMTRHRFTKVKRTGYKGPASRRR